MLLQILLFSSKRKFAMFLSKISLTIYFYAIRNIEENLHEKLIMYSFRVQTVSLTLHHALSNWAYLSLMSLLTLFLLIVPC